MAGTPFDEPDTAPLPSPSLADGVDDPQKDVPRLQPKDLMIDALLGQQFKQIDLRKRFDPFYLDDENNAGPSSFGVPKNDAQLTGVFDSYLGEAAPGPTMPGSGGSPTAGPDTSGPQPTGGSDPSAPTGGNPFDVQGGEGGMPVTPPDQRMAPTGPDRAGDFSPNLDPYGSDMREALRRIVRNS